MINEIDLEKSVLEGIYSLSDKQKQFEFYNELNGKLFINEDNLKLYNAFGKILVKEMAIDQVTLFEETKDKILATQLNVSNWLNLGEHIKLLKERKYKTDIVKSIESHLEVIKMGTHHDDIDDIKNQFIADMSGIELDAGSQFIDFEITREKLKSNITNDSKIEGYSWNISELDSYTSGIVRPRLIVVGGLKKSGKTRFIINTRKALYGQGIPSPFLSLEVPEYELSKPTYSSFLDMNDLQFRSKSFMSKHDYEKFQKCDIDFSLLPTECISGLTIEQVISRIRRYSKLFPNGVIFIDYLQRILHDRNKQAQQLEDFSARIADTTRTNNTTIILLSQLSNSAEGNQPSVGHLKGSGGIGEAADVILLLDNKYRRTKRDMDKNKMDIIVEQRYGDSGKISIHTDLGKCKFSDLPRIAI